jgi:diguanylate cyclase (GGDEF)-like protein/PAS domain S-box-containing protein
MRVVVAEDVPDINEAVQEQIERLGHSVAGVAYNGPEVVRLVEETRPDAVLMDLIMIDPETGREDRGAGEKATARIMASAPCPIVWLSSFESQGATRRAADSGVAGYLVKPVDDNELDRALVIAAARFADARALAEANAELRRVVASRTAAERAVRESEERFRRLFEDSPTGIALVGLDGGLLNVNEALGEMVGTSKEDLPGRSLLDLAHPEDRQHIASMLHGLVDAGTGEFCEDVRLHGPAGAIIWARASGRLLGSEGRDSSQVLLVLANISERKELESRLRFLSFHDPLTGLYNRTFFEEEAARAGASRRNVVSVLVADLDGLKAVNDRLGHAAGDELIRHAANVLRGAFRLEDVVARVGGDEFAALMVGAEASAAVARASRVRAFAERHVADGCTCGLRLSLGVATVQPGEPISEALHEADLRMYEEKRRGRFGDPSPS